MKLVWRRMQSGLLHSEAQGNGHWFIRELHTKERIGNERQFRLFAYERNFTGDTFNSPEEAQTRAQELEDKLDPAGVTHA